MKITMPTVEIDIFKLAGKEARAIFGPGGKAGWYWQDPRRLPSGPHKTKLAALEDFVRQFKAAPGRFR